MKKISVLLVGLMLVACSSTKPSSTQSTQQDNNASKAAAASTTASAVTSATTAADPLAASKAKEIASLAEKIKEVHPESDAASTANLASEIQKLHNESVYFDFDEYAIKPAFRDAIEKQAKSFNDLKHASLVLEGNCDERGSAAYNMALGAKRATSVKKQLVALGIAKSKIKVVSYGNTKPKLDCHEEKCWQENRRVDFVINQK